MSRLCEVLSLLAVALLFATGCWSEPIDIVGGSGSQRGHLVLNSDNESRHSAYAILPNGMEYDLWVYQDESGDPDYVSDLRVRLPNDTVVYLQFDALGRPSLVRDSDGYSARVHFYLEGQQAEVTFSDPDGRSFRGVMDTTVLLPPEPGDEQEGTKRIAFAWSKDSPSYTIRSQPVREVETSSSCGVIHDFTQQERSLFGAYAMLTSLECIHSVDFDDATFSTIVDRLNGCSASDRRENAAVSMLVEGSRQLADLALTCDYELEDLGQDDAPEPPPSSGDVYLGSGDVHVTLSWDNATDVDLHVVDPSGEEIYFAHPWSESGGQLDVDDIDGFGPENIFWSTGTAPAGTYTVSVLYYSSAGRGPSNYDVTLQYTGTDGERVIENYSGTLISDGDSDTLTTFVLGSPSDQRPGDGEEPCWHGEVVGRVFSLADFTIAGAIGATVTATRDANGEVVATAVARTNGSYEMRADWPCGWYTLSAERDGQVGLARSSVFIDGDWYALAGQQPQVDIYMVAPAGVCDGVRCRPEELCDPYSGDCAPAMDDNCWAGRIEGNVYSLADFNIAGAVGAEVFAIHVESDDVVATAVAGVNGHFQMRQNWRCGWYDFRAVDDNGAGVRRWAVYVNDDWTLRPADHPYVAIYMEAETDHDLCDGVVCNEFAVCDPDTGLCVPSTVNGCQLIRCGPGSVCDWDLETCVRNADTTTSIAPLP